MQNLPFRVETYTGKPYHNLNVVYALNKGMNTGKPSFAPFVNCFAIVCPCKDVADRIFATLTLLLKARAFEIYLNGSVIPFIHIKDFKTVLSNNSQFIINDDTAKDLQKILLLIQHQKALEAQTKKTSQLITAYARTMINIF